jgi:CheY-like chemotaxis protein
MSASLENTSILVVDDNADLCELLRGILGQCGACVAVAHSVEGALDVFRKSPPHAVIADIRLRDSDGYALVDAIRKFNAEYKGFTPVIAVTGFASPEDEERALASGFAAYISKPFEPQQIIDATAKVLWGSTDRAA